MNSLLTLTSRNLKQYFRDKGAVFFSLLSMFIVIVLMFFFMGDSNTDGIMEILNHYPDRDPVQDQKNADLLILTWTCAGMVSINAVTVTLSSLSYMIKDRENGKLSSIYTTPVSRLVIALSNVLAAWISSVIICTATLVVSELYAVSQGLTPFSFCAHLRMLGYIAANSFTYATLMFLAASLVKSSGAWGGIGTIIGTLVGFLGGIYLSIGEASASIAAIIKSTPVIYGTALFRGEMTSSIAQTTFSGLPSEVLTGFNRAVGTELTIGNHVLTAPEELAVLLVCSAVFLLGGALVVRFSKKSDR